MAIHDINNKDSNSTQAKDAAHKIARVDFSFRREVFFVVIGALAGAVTMIAPKTFFEVQMGLPYYLTWMAFGRIIGDFSSASVISGMVLHLITAISIGIIAGIFLYKTNILNISKPSNGLIYGIITGVVVFAAFFIPVNQFVLSPEIIQTVLEVQGPTLAQEEASQMLEDNMLTIIIGSLIMHLVFGITLGLVSSFLEIRFGAKYRCSDCDIAFSRLDSLLKHIELVHGPLPIKQKRILILGGGFAGTEVLKGLQDIFQDDIEVDITLVSDNNYFLFTPMLHEVSAGAIETRHIATPIRQFCKRARFYQASIESVDIKNKQVIIKHHIGRDRKEQQLLQQQQKQSSSVANQINDNNYTLDIEGHRHILLYDYLVVALGSEPKFFGLSDIERNAFTMKNLNDAIILRNHVIDMLEQADFEHEDKQLRKSLLTFIVVGGGFSGVETVGSLNDFVKGMIKEYYYNLDAEKDPHVILVSSKDRLLEEMDEELGKFALEKLEESGVEVILNAHAKSAGKNNVVLDNGTSIRTHTLIWAAGVTTQKIVSNIDGLDHDKKSGRVMVDDHLQCKGQGNIFALGDCAYIKHPVTGKPFPPTAQHAIREGRVAANNIAQSVKDRKDKMKSFDYETKGMMATVGEKSGVAIVFKLKLHGFAAWWLWRTFYLANLPTVHKKIRVVIDWTVDLFFRRDVSSINIFEKQHATERQKFARSSKEEHEAA